MKRVIQEQSEGCGIACVAMVAGKSYEQVRYAMFGDSRKAYCRTSDVIFGLREFKIKIKTNKLIRVNQDDIKDMKGTALILAKVIDEGVGHWMVWDARAKRILDPLQPRLKKNQYRITSYLPISR